MLAPKHDVSGSLLTSIITASVALIPSPIANYFAKFVTVFVLAMAAEAGRRFVSVLWKGKGHQ